jgi:hypothetical protein
VHLDDDRLAFHAVADVELVDDPVEFGGQVSFASRRAWRADPK